MLYINELFTSIQGEGIRAGVPATFIRLQGCDVGCPFCDTRYAWKEGDTLQAMTEEQIMEQVKAPYTIITGGEPLMQNITKLLMLCNQAKRWPYIETSGKYWLEDLEMLARVTLSPKAKLGYDFRADFEIIADEVKLVVDDNLDEEIIHGLMDRFGGRKYTPPPPFVLMPESYNWKPYLLKPEMVKKAYDLVMKINSPWVRYGDRLQCRLGVK